MVPYTRDMQNAPRVSIIIPAYNEERHLAACLQAIAAQTVVPFEVIVVDNNSTDATAAIARQHRKQLPMLRVVAAKDQGRVYARNAGFNAATGDIFARIDADTMLPPGWLARIAAFYAEPAHATKLWTSPGRFTNVVFPALMSATYAAFIFGFNRVLWGNPTLWGSSMAVPAALWNEVKDHVCLRNDIHEDLDLTIHLCDRGARVYVDRTIHVAATLRRVHSEQSDRWTYMQWWPRTLRIHGKRLWWLCWIFGAAMMHVAALLADWALWVLTHLRRKKAL